MDNSYKNFNIILRNIEFLFSNIKDIRYKAITIIK